jgi:glycosyltransferase involved in cell wall biosynthesis
MATLTVAILTQNEAKRIGACIRSAQFADQVLVIDGGSTDGTAELARGLDAEVHVYADWQGFAAQRNRQIAHARGDFILFLDADEEITTELRAELRDVVARNEAAVWSVGWTQVAFGRTLHRMRSTVSVQRLFQRANLLRFEGVVHEHPVLQSPHPVRKLRHRLLHHSRETVYGSLLKLAQYAQLGAVKRAQLGKTGGVVRGLLSGGACFFRLYVMQLGVLCGAQGFLYCLFVSLECFFRYAALRYDQGQLDDVVKRT